MTELAQCEEKEEVWLRLLWRQNLEHYIVIVMDIPSMAVNDAMKLTKCICKALETTHEITKLIKHSPRRDGIFRQLERAHDQNSGFQFPGMRLLCPTRWTVRLDSLRSVLDNYEALMNNWEEALHIVHDKEMKARTDGIVLQMQTFNFAFGTFLAELIL